jgi:hypothetical protein
MGHFGILHALGEGAMGGVVNRSMQISGVGMQL